MALSNRSNRRVKVVILGVLLAVLAGCPGLAPDPSFTPGSGEEDFGTLDDLTSKDRELYIENILPLTHPGSQFFLWCFEWPTRWWEKSFPFPHYLEPGEVERRFGEWFEVECIVCTMEPHLWKFEPGTATCLMTRKEVEP